MPRINHQKEIKQPQYNNQAFTYIHLYLPLPVFVAMSIIISVQVFMSTGDVLFLLSRDSEIHWP